MFLLWTLRGLWQYQAPQQSQDPGEQTPQSPAERCCCVCLSEGSPMAFQGCASASQRLHNPETPSIALPAHDTPQCAAVHLPLDSSPQDSFAAAVPHCLKQYKPCYKSICPSNLAWPFPMLKPPQLSLGHGVRNARSQWQIAQRFSFPSPPCEGNLNPNTLPQCLLINSDHIMNDRDDFISILENSSGYKIVIS